MCDIPSSLLGMLQGVVTRVPGEFADFISSNYHFSVKMIVLVNIALE